MQITEEKGGVLAVTRGSARGAKDESHFWFLLREEMRKASPDWKKIREPFTLSAMPYALRLGRRYTRNWFIVDSDYCIRCPKETYNAGRTVYLSRVQLGR